MSDAIPQRMESSSDRGAEGPASGEAVRAVTLRSVGTALVVIALSILWDEWISYHFRGSNISRSHFPMAFFFPFLVTVTISMLLHRLRPGLGLSRSELLVVLAAGLVAIIVPYDGIMGHLIGVISGPYYFATPESGWEIYLYQYIPTWLVPQDQNNAMHWFYEGLPAGEGFPLTVWVAPLFWWMSLLGSVAFAVFCAVVMLRRQWIEHERLTYPIVEVGQMLTETEPGGRLPAFFRSPLFWVAFGIVMALKLWNIISYFSPTFPFIRIEGGALRLLPDFPILIQRISFYAIGFGYFARLDVLFSVWFFIVLTAFEVYAFNRFGYTLGEGRAQWSSQALMWQSLGGLLFLAVWSLWMARNHLGAVWRKALRPAEGVDDSGELLSYRTAVFGFMGSMVYAGAWLRAAGMELWVVLAFLPVATLTFLGLSRVVAELGLVYSYYRVQPYDAVLKALGTPLVGPSSVTALAFMRAFSSIGKGFVMPSFTQAVKVVDRTVRPRRVATVIWVALAVGVAVSLIDTLYVGYTYGGYHMRGLSGAARGPFNQAVAAIRNPLPWGGGGRLMWAGIGAAALAAMTFLRYRISWWTLHPIGLAIQAHYGTTKTLFSIFIVWSVKSILMRIGGVQLYERWKPFFIGLLAAQAFSTGLVFLIDVIWFPIRGHNVHNY